MEIEITDQFLRDNAIKKYRILQNQNPLIKNLIEGLNLKIDYDTEREVVQKKINKGITSGTIKLPR
jgi:hypothetical protein